MQSEEIKHIETVKIDDLATDGLQVRVELDEKTIVKYAETMADDDEFRPIVVFRDPARPESAPCLADGFHRIEAARRLGHDTIPAEVREGSFNDALRCALSVNSRHGLNMNENDVANVCRIAWGNRRMLIPDVTEESIHFVTKFARICGISRKTAYKHINKLNCNPVTKLSESISADGDTTHGAQDPSALPTQETAGEMSDATVVTREHLEERNPKVRALLKQGIDRYGMPIPERILNAFRSKVPKGMIRTLGDVRKKLEKAYLDGDPAFAAIGQDGIIALDNAIRRFRYGIPWCVCRACHGEGCASCGKRGFQTKFQYDRLPREYKADEGTANK